MLIALVGHSDLSAARIGVFFPGAVSQLLHEAALELFSVIMIAVLVWEYFQMDNLKTRECGLERMISFWCCYGNVLHAKK